MSAGHLFARDDCKDNSNLCEKPYADSSTLGIIVGVSGGLIVVVLFILLLFLHIRRKRRDDHEWGKDQQELEDYGFDPEVVGGRRKAGVQAPAPARGPGGGGGKYYAKEDDFDNLPDSKPVNSPHELAAQLSRRDRDDTYGSATQVPRALV